MDVAPVEFEALVTQFAGRVEAGQMMGKPALMRDGAMIACYAHGGLGIKLGRDTAELSDALQLPGAVLFDPSGKGRPFRDWASIPLEQHVAWPDLLAAAVDAADAAALQQPAP